MKEKQTVDVCMLLMYKRRYSKALNISCLFTVIRKMSNINSFLDISYISYSYSSKPIPIAFLRCSELNTVIVAHVIRLIF